MDNINKEPEELSTGINFKGIILFTLQYWYLFLISLILGFVGAKLYLRYTQPVYGIQATVLVKDNKKGAGMEDFLEGMELLSTSRNVQNEMHLISSYNNVNKAIQELNFQVSYYVQGNIKTGELYKISPFTVRLDTSFNHSSSVALGIKILSDSTFIIYPKDAEHLDLDDSASLHKNNHVYKFGELCKSDNYRFVIYKSNFFYKKIESSEYYFVIHELDKLTLSYISKLKIELASKSSSILMLSTQGLVPQKEIDFLNKLCEVYIDAGLQEKNQIAINTIRFIDGQLGEIIDSLKGAERRLEGFRSSEKMMNFSSAAEKAYSQLDELEKEKAELLVKDKYYNYLLEYVSYNYDIKQIIAPSAMGMDDPLLNNLISELHTLNLEKASLGFSTNEDNPTSNINKIKIDNVKKALIENLKNILQASKITLKDNQDRLIKIQDIINRLPASERNLVNIQRKFNLNDHIYNYLMEKRIEAGIAKSANLPDNKVVNGAMLYGKNPIGPNKNLVYIVAIMIGFFIPTLFVYYKLYFNDTVFNKDVLEKSLSLPIIGEITHYRGSESIPIINSPKSGFSESIRSLRVNLQYLAANKKNKIIGVTSSISGEGKTFFSSNLAASIALSNSKVVLVGADLRKPKLQNIYGLSNDFGLSTYYINKTPLHEVIKKTQIPNLDIILSGPVPPNPTELLESSKSEELINYLLSNYEYIIIDAPPVGIVADYYLLAKYVDANLYVVRENYTKKELLKIPRSIKKSNKLKNLFMVFNDVQSHLRYGYGYKYGGYGYGYYEDDTEKTAFTNLKNRLSTAFKMK